MERQTTFIHMTDLHVGDADDTHLFSDTAETLEQILADVAKVEPRPSFIVASGDLTNRGDAESFRRLKAIMETSGLPVIYALGNHDTRPGFYEGMGVDATSPETSYDHDTVIDGVHIITLDSTSPGLIGGTIEDEQFVWLEQALDRHVDLPKLIVSHHAPALDESAADAPWRSIRLEDSERLGTLLCDRMQKGRSILGILSGHIHHDRVSIWNGILVVVGMGQHAATDLLRTDVLRMVKGASFGIGTVRRSGLTIAFVPQPSDREELNVYPLDMLRKTVMQLAAE